MEKNYVSYRDFGAVGDGITNDYFAMKAAHKYANENGLAVKGEPGDSYLISDKEIDGVAESIEIKTDTDWCGATIILDDTNFRGEWGKPTINASVNPFVIKSDYTPTVLPNEICEAINASGGIKDNNLKKIETGLGYPALLIISNSEERVYIRYGNNQNNGTEKRELIVVDKEGNIDPSTPFLFDYDKVEKITAYRIDDKPITVENATFISRASRVNLVDQYRNISSGISVERSNTAVKNLYHKIVGEIDKYAVVDKDSNILPGYRYDRDTAKVFDPEGREVTDGSALGFIGHSYGAFLRPSNANNVLIEGVTFQSRIYYLQGTYDLGCGMSNNVTFKNCDQSNFFSNDRPDMPRYPAMGKWWGVGGSSFCKNMTYDGCRLTRYDAHSSLVNGKILNSEIAITRLTGAGEMLIENTKIYGYASTLISLREDYGATWRGTITIKDCEIYDVCNECKLKSLFTCLSANHWFGYPVYFPNIVIDNLKIENANPSFLIVNDPKYNPNVPDHYFRSVYEPGINTPGAICGNGRENINVLTPPKFIKVINNEKNGYEFNVYQSEFFKDTELVGVNAIPYPEAN